MITGNNGSILSKLQGVGVFSSSEITPGIIRDSSHKSETWFHVQVVKAVLWINCFIKKASIYLVFLSGWWEAGIKDCPKIFEIVQILWILHNLKYFWTILYSWPFSPETFNFQIIWVFFLNFPSIFRSILTKFFTALKVNQSTKIKKRYWFSKFCFILFIFWKLSFAGRSDCHTTKPCARTPYSVQTSNQNKKKFSKYKKVENGERLWKSGFSGQFWEQENLYGVCINFQSIQCQIEKTSFGQKYPDAAGKVFQKLPSLCSNRFRSNQQKVVLRKIFLWNTL